MRKLLILTLALGLTALWVGSAQANHGAGNVAANPGFETDPTDMTPGDWFKFSSGAPAVSQHSTLDPHSGTGHMDLQTAGGNQFAGVFQTLSHPVKEGYKVIFSGWHKSLVDPFNGTREVKIEWVGAPQLRVDEFVIGTDYEEFMLMGIAPAGTTGATVTYAISTFNPDAGENNVYLDDINVTVIPEPASVMLGAIGLLGLVGLVRRRR